jgi:hypothetical protein
MLSCAPGPNGLRETPEGPGPVVVMDWDALPLPEVPFPNDLATRADPSSVTGLRVNISMQATTELEARARRKIDELVGFGIYAPITVSFDAPLDLDEIVDRHADDNDQSDDAFYLIDVNPASPDYLKLIELDVGHGRFPQDVARSDKYFPNDPHVDMPSLMFDTTDEDLDGDGVLDPGEDLDNDGWLDVPNVYPVGGDPREDLLTFYERITNTLIVRPVVPLREENTYAVVLTERLIGEDGNPVRSPWAFVNHTRQTEALQPVLEALSDLGLSVEDVSFAWTYTTGRVTGDLVDIRRSLDGEGPWPFLPEDYPPGIHTASIMHDNDALGNPYMLPINVLISVLGASGEVEPEALDLLMAGYEFGEAVVGGLYTTPNLLADRDDGGGDSVDEWWELDPLAGTLSAEAEEVNFTCAIPKETAEHKAPFPVVIYGHGYGSNRLEGFLFGYAFLRMGVASCSIDFPGHGVGLSASDRADFVELMEPLGMVPVLEHLEASRHTDTNNDGTPDSGSHQWTADAFHTRDQVRQAVVDWMWFVRSLQQCGTDTMDMDGEAVVSCDWNDDGTPDIGGPNNDFFLAGGSLGGIVAGVAVPVMPDIKAHALIVAGGGLMDISTRAPTGGAVEAMHGKLMSPLILGRPQDDGTIKITLYVNNFMDMHELTIATLDSVPAGGRVVVENLYNGEVREGRIPDDGAFRVGIAADALDYFEKREFVGIPDTGTEEGVTYSVPDNIGIGDELVVTILDAGGTVVAKLDTFEVDNTFEGVTFEAGSTLVAAASGLGKIRAAPGTRRLMMVVAMAIEPGDPISYAPHYVDEPFEVLGGKVANVLLVPTPGDMVVSINSEIAIARAAGFIERHEIDPRYGMTVDRWLIDRQVVRGLEEYGPWTDINGDPALFDADDLDDGTDDYGAPSEAPLRVTIATESGISGMRLPYVDPHGSHGFGVPNPTLGFDINLFSLNQLARFLSSRGTIISDEPCMATDSCSWIPTLEEAE